MKRYKCLLFTIMISAAVLLTSCGSQGITQADLDEAYQQGYSDGYSTATDEDTQPQETESEPEPSIPEASETPEAPQPSPTMNNDTSPAPQVQPDPDASMSAELADNDDENLIALITAMQTSAPIIDTKPIVLNEGTNYESDMIYMPGEHIGEYNGVQVDNMLNLSSDAYNEKYYTVTDDLKIVEITLQNAYDKNWLEIGYTNCVPAIRYDSAQNRYEENPYDMVHPGWHHTYAVMYKCVWSDGNPRYGVYYISVYNDTDQELMAILCPIQQVSDGMNLW